MTTATRERPLLMSGPMVRAILAGKKTQTRRVMKPQPPDWIRDFGVSAFTPAGEFSGRGNYPGQGYAEKFFKCPFGVPGDRLWCRETWQTGMTDDGPRIAFKSTGDASEIDAWNGEDYGVGPSFNYDQCPGASWHTWLPDLIAKREGVWRPSIHMPRWASRLTLEITDVRVERLNEISREDVPSEGIPDYGHEYRDGMTEMELDEWRNRTRIENFAFVWDSINGKTHPWASNPWVWAITFRRANP